MFEYLIDQFIEALKEEYGPLFSGGYKRPFDDKIGINSDIQYQFYLVDNEKSGNFNLSIPENKFGPTLFTKEFRLVIQFTKKIDAELLRTKTIKVLNLFSANGIRYNEDSKTIQDIETKQKPKLEIPLMMFTFNLKKAVVLNDCKDKIMELSC